MSIFTIESISYGKKLFTLYYTVTTHMQPNKQTYAIIHTHTHSRTQAMIPNRTVFFISSGEHTESVEAYLKTNISHKFIYKTDNNNNGQKQQPRCFTFFGCAQYVCVCVCEFVRAREYSKLRTGSVLKIFTKCSKTTYVSHTQNTHTHSLWTCTKQKLHLFFIILDCCLLVHSFASSRLSEINF